MLYNKHPEKDHNGNKRADLAGQPLSANGFSACVFAMTRDGEWFQNEYKLKGASSKECCFNCQANRSDIPYNDFRASAAWRKTVTKHKGKCPTSHVISKIPGVVGETFAYDSLHIIEEGVAAHAIANCFFDWVIKPGWAGVQEARLKALFHKILKQYEELGIPSSNRIPKLTFSNFCNPKSKYKNFPDLSGFKAKHIRCLVPCVVELCQQHARHTPCIGCAASSPCSSF